MAAPMRVPPVEMRSSTITQTAPSTSPMTLTTSTVSSRGSRLSMTAIGASRMRPRLRARCPPPGSGELAAVRHQLGADRIGRLGLLLLALVPVVRDHRGDARRRGTAQRVEDDEQLDQVVADGMARRLHQEDVVAANRLADLDVELTVREARDLALGELHADLSGDSLAELGVAAAREQQQLAVGVGVGHDWGGRLAAHPSLFFCRAP